jgi:hypothetical protein
MTNEEKVVAIFAILELSKVSMTDFSRLSGISRASLYNWKAGANVTDMLRLRDAYAFALRLNKAVEMKKLPLVGLYKLTERVQVLKRIIGEANKEMGR